MKTTFLSAALLLACTLVAGSASAASYTTTIAPNAYNVTGDLAANSEVTFTFNANGKNTGNYFLADGSEYIGSTNAFSQSLDPIDGSPATNSASTNVGGTNGGVLTVLTLAKMGGISSITIENLTGQLATFEAVFSAPFLSGTFSVAGPLATPLPAAAVMFITAMIGLAGFSLYKKQNSKA